MASSPNPANEKVVYVQDGVFLQTSRCHRDERGLLSGKVMLSEGKHGAFVVWERDTTFGSSDAVAGGGDRATPTRPSVTGQGVSFRNRSSGSVSMPIEDTPMRPFRYELTELSSYRTGDEDHSMVLVMRDGSSTNALMFQGDAMDNFVRALTKYLKIKRSKRDKNLFLVKDVREEALSQSFAPMDFFDGLSDIRGSGPALIRGLISNINEIRHDPKTAAMATFSKLYNVVSESLQGPEDTESRPSWEIAEILQQSLSPAQSNEDVSCSKTSGVSSLTEQGFEVIEAYNVSMPPLKPMSRGEPLSRREWEDDMIDVDGRVIEPDIVKARIFRGGVEPGIRKDVWKYLLGVVDWNMTYNRAKEREKSNLDYYYRMKFQWKSISADQETRFSGYRDRKSLVEKDVLRTDRVHPFYAGDGNKHVEMLSDILMSYIMFNFDLGYVQGMSDLLSPILCVMGDEVDAFWCFKGFLDRVGSNFALDQDGMKRQLHDLQQLLSVVDPKFLSYLEGRKSGQLYFLFRWLLIWFKREFSFEDVQRLWEVLWTGLPCKNFHLLFCVALLQTAKHTITENEFGFNEILKHVNDMSMKMDVDDSLAKAEALYNQLKEARGVPKVVKKILDLPAQVGDPDEDETDGARAKVPNGSSSSDTDEKCEAGLNNQYF